MRGALEVGQAGAMEKGGPRVTVMEWCCAPREQVWGAMRSSVWDQCLEATG